MPYYPPQWARGQHDFASTVPPVTTKVPAEVHSRKKQ